MTVDSQKETSNFKQCAIDDVKYLNVDRKNFRLLLSYSARHMTLAGNILTYEYVFIVISRDVYGAPFAQLYCVLHLKSNEAVDNLTSSMEAATIKNGDRRLHCPSIRSPGGERG